MAEVGKRIEGRKGKKVIDMRCIDADALIGSLHNYGFYDGNDRTMVYKVIQLQPTIEPERKKGKWINDEHDIPRCSECKHIPEYNWHIDDYYYSDFCPNCGADMTEDE